MATAAHAAPAPPAIRTTIPASIVPLRGLPFVALALAALVTAIATDWTWGLNFFHVACGGAWTALDLFLGFVIGPIMRQLPPPARAEVSARLMPKMLLIMPTLVTLTLAPGFQLAREYGFLLSEHPRHGWIVASYIVVGVMTVAALAILTPANIAVLFEMRKPEPSFELIGRLMRRYLYMAGLTGVMQVATLVIMTRLPT